MIQPRVSILPWRRLGPLLPPLTPSPKGGRPRADDRACLEGILFVRSTGLPWDRVPKELGRERRRLLAPPARLAGRGLLGEAPPGPAREPRPQRRARLVPRLPGLHERRGEKGVGEVGPNPADRGRPGTKRRLIVERGGVPLACLLSGTNRNDRKLLEPLLDAAPRVRGRSGRPRSRPAKPHADEAYDHAFCREACPRRGVAPRIARKGVESSERLGRHRWRVERTASHLKPFRRLTVRWERKAEPHLAFLTLARAAICARRLLDRLGL